MHLIFRETKSDRNERLYGRAKRSGKPISAIARNVDEAADVAYHEMEHRDGFTDPIACEGGPETKQVFEDDMKRIGQDPERVAREWGLE